MKLHKLLGESVDTLCFVLILSGALFLFSYYWSDTYQLEYAEHIAGTFLSEAERVQSISSGDYRNFAERLNGINNKFEVSLQIQRAKMVIYEEDIESILLTQGKVGLCAGDFVTVTISKGQRKRSVQFAVIWW